MSALARQRDPVAVNKIMSLVESGLTPEEIVKTVTAEMDHSEGGLEESFTSELKLVSQALAFRRPSISDTCEITSVLNEAYMAEIKGRESFREGVGIDKRTIESIFCDDSYKWIVVESPNGQGIVNDGAIIGVCCYSTDGVSRKNGI